MTATAATWRLTAETDDLDYRCDLPGCGEPADTVHFLPWVTNTEQVLFGCPAHDPGGYWTDIKGFWTIGPGDSRSMADHIERKNGGPDALAKYGERIDALRVVQAVAS